MSTSLNVLIPELQPFARDFVDELGRQGLQPRITSTLRTHAEQQRLYRRFLQGLQPYYVAPPGTSPHEFGYAFDLVCQDLEYAGQVWLSWGGEWGGRSTRGHGYDPVHFQYPGFTQSASYQPRQGTPSVEELIAAGLISGVEGVAEIGQFFGLELPAIGLQFLR